MAFAAASADQQRQLASTSQADLAGGLPPAQLRRFLYAESRRVSQPAPDRSFPPKPAHCYAGLEPITTRSWQPLEDLSLNLPSGAPATAPFAARGPGAL